MTNRLELSLGSSKRGSVIEDVFTPTKESAWASYQTKNTTLGEDVLPPGEESAWVLYTYDIHGLHRGSYYTLSHRHSRLGHTRHVQDAVSQWVALAEAQELKRSEEANIADWFTTKELKVVRARLAASSVKDESTDSRRLTHETLRRTSWAAFLAAAATQFIFLVTGVTILHPMAAVLVAGVAASFYGMSQLMRKELEEVFRG